MMGTRCLTRVFEGDTEVACIYRHWDGYPDGHGKDLVAMLSDKRIVNGYSSAAKLPKEQRLNGPGRVAAFIVCELSRLGHDPDILPPKSEAGEDFEYHVKCENLVPRPGHRIDSLPDGVPIIVECFSVSGGWGGKPRVLERVSLQPSSNSEGTKP